MINVIDACRSEGVGKLILASSSEVYQTPPHAPTDETAPLRVLDAIDPR
jgi:nucleoside-diphosphate-sugar epimerase